MLRQRVVTASALAAVALLGIFFLPTAAIAGVCALIGFTAGVEWAALTQQRSIGAYRWIYGSFIAAGVLLFWKFSEFNLLGVAAAGLFWVILLSWVGKLVILKQPGRMSPHLTLGVLVLAPALGLIPYLHGVPVYGTGLLLTVLLIVWIGDIGAYFGGRRFGKSLFAPQISPGKTWAGVWSGLILSVLVGWGSAYALSLPVDRPWLLWVSLVVAAIAGIFADLFESILKRSTGKKDSGNLLPGHGGILDRIDSMLGAVPLFAGLSLLF
jgi:phosphatidate cytidylyltransferase